MPDRHIVYQDTNKSNKANFVGVKKYNHALDTGSTTTILSKYTHSRHLLERTYGWRTGFYHFEF